jgi:pimeloyl-ACP methyl ester carboxylesterase
MRIRMNDGVELAVERAGDGPALLLVHGHGGAKEDFAEHVPRLAETHTVVTFDHRGHGASDKPDERDAYSLDRLVDDTLEVADSFGFTNFRLLGHSMGGMVARKVVIREPARIDALIMMDTTARRPDDFHPELFEIAAEIAFTQGKEALLELLDYAKPLETEAHLRTVRERPGYKEFCDKKNADVSAVAWGALALAMAEQGDDTAALVAALRGPLLVLVGEQDEPFHAVSQELADAVPGALLVVIPDAGHSPQAENPTAWIATVSDFLA